MDSVPFTQRVVVAAAAAAWPVTQCTHGQTLFFFSPSHFNLQRNIDMDARAILSASSYRFLSRTHSGTHGIMLYLAFRGNIASP